jgi:carboxyl-terminal processing protease
VQQALISLQSSGKLQGIILDLRDNPGGLLDMAVDVVEKFAPKGSLVVSTRGRRPDSERKYVATEDPMTTLPLVVLINRNSASASEIVAGAIQDLDRGLIVGKRTFGKGLVQSVVPISQEGAELKVTTARYYTPSGRSIQEIDYLRKREGVLSTVPDSLRKIYYTLHHRRVLDAGGIQPDSTVRGDTTNRYVGSLFRTAMFFTFANSYVAHHKDIGEKFIFDSTIVIEFHNYLAAQNFDYEDESDAKIKDLREFAVVGHYPASFTAHLNQLAHDIDSVKARAFENNRDVIAAGLKEELEGRYKGERGRIEASFDSDQTLSAAIGILHNSRLYEKMLGLR